MTCSPRPRRAGVALLMCMFIMSATSLILTGILQTQRLQMLAARNTADYERALNLASSGVHHALAQLEANPAWRGQIPLTEFPRRSGDRYSASAVDGAPGTVLLNGVGEAGDVIRRLQVSVAVGP